MAKDNSISASSSSKKRKSVTKKQLTERTLYDTVSFFINDFTSEIQDPQLKEYVLSTLVRMIESHENFDVNDFQCNYQVNPLTRSSELGILELMDKFSPTKGNQSVEGFSILMNLYHKLKLHLTNFNSMLSLLTQKEPPAPKKASFLQAFTGIPEPSPLGRMVTIIPKSLEEIEVVKMIDYENWARVLVTKGPPEVYIEVTKEKTFSFTYYQNLLKTQNSPYIVSLEFVLHEATDPQKQVLLVRKYDMTLGGLLMRFELKCFWYEVASPDDKRHKFFVMTSPLKHIIRKLVKGIVYLNSKQISVDLDVDDVVFPVDDHDFQHPKIRNLVLGGPGVEFDIKKSFLALSVMLDHLLEKAASLGSQSSHCITHFQTSLKEVNENTDMGKLINHPAFWSPLKKLDLMLSLHYALEFNLCKVSKTVEYEFQSLVHGNWIRIAKLNMFLANRMDHASKLNTPKLYSKTLSSFVDFVRDNFSHINERMQTMPHIHWSWVEIETLFEVVFPEVVPLLHNHIDIEKLSIGPSYHLEHPKLKRS